MQIFIAGSHTDAGKTATSAALCQAFGLDYFKLVQAGIPQDCEVVAKLSKDTKIHTNGITLKTPQSPHLAMQEENIFYDGLKIPLPNAKNLIIESAGGLFTPLDSKNCMIDYLEAKKLPCFLVANYYLGSINHILLSIDALKARGIPLLALIISKAKNPKMDDFISKYSGVKIAHFETFNNKLEFLKNAQNLKEQLKALQIL